MAGSLQRYYVLDGCGGVELEVLCEACARQRQRQGQWRQHAATPVAWEHPDLVCADCGAGCECPACATPEDAWLEAAYEDRYEPDYDA